MSRFSAIDIGSNAIRLLIAESEGDGFTVLVKKRYPFRLGTEAFSKQQMFSSETIKGAGHLFARIKEELTTYNVENYLAFATSAFRDAKNSKDLARAIEKKSGLVIKELSGSLEADIIQSSVLSGFNMDDDCDYLLADLGGGSLELSQIEHGLIAGSRSFNLGTVRFLIKNYKDEKAIAKDFDDYKKDILKFLDDKIIKSKNLHMIGTGGNFRRIIKIMNALRKEQGKSFLSYIVPSELAYTRYRMERISLQERVELFGLKEDQAEVIIPALYIIEMLVDLLPMHKIYAPKASLADGILKKIHEGLKEKQESITVTI